MAARHSALLTACCDYVAARGGLLTKMQAGRVRVGKGWIHMGKRGWPDAVGLLPGGQFLGVEVKIGRDTVNEAQARMHAEIQKRGGVVVVVRDLRDLQSALEVA